MDRLSHKIFACIFFSFSFLIDHSKSLELVKHFMLRVQILEQQIANQTEVIANQSEVIAEQGRRLEELESYNEQFEENKTGMEIDKFC